MTQAHIAEERHKEDRRVFALYQKVHLTLLARVPMLSLLSEVIQWSLALALALAVHCPRLQVQLSGKVNPTGNRITLSLVPLGAITYIYHIYMYTLANGFLVWLPLPTTIT